jgi:outer membrane lipoprotein SlyB
MKIFLFALFLAVSSCSSRPQLYPNSKLKFVGKEKAQKDIEKCMTESDEYFETSKGKKVLKSAGKGAVVGSAFGAAMGAVAGAFTGNMGRGLVRGGAIGASGGAAGSAASTAISPDEIKRRYVNQCLSEKGYQVLGWE